MSQVRVHNFSISLDGFGTGDGLTFDAPFGHAGERLHEWMFATRFWHSMTGDSGGTTGVDHSFAARHSLGIGAEIMGRGKFGPQKGPWKDLDWQGWWGDTPPFHTPVFVLTHHVRPTFSLSDTRVKANPQMKLTVEQDNNEEELATVVLKIPAGFKLPTDAAVPNNDQLGSGTINIHGGPGCRPGAPQDADAPITAPATINERDRTDEQQDLGVYAVWLLDISGVTNVPLVITGSRAAGWTLTGEIAPNDNTCPPFSFEVNINSQSASGVPIIKNPGVAGKKVFKATFTSADSPASVTIRQPIRIKP